MKHALILLQILQAVENTEKLSYNSKTGEFTFRPSNKDYALLEQMGLFKNQRLTPGGKHFYFVPNPDKVSKKALPDIVAKYLNYLTEQIYQGLPVTDNLREALETMVLTLNLQAESELFEGVPQEVLEEVKEDEKYLMEMMAISENKVENFGLDVSEQKDQVEKKTKKSKNKSEIKN